MNAEGMPSLRVQTVCVYSVRSLSRSAASDCSASRMQHAAAQKERIRLAARKARIGTRVFDSTPEPRRLIKLRICTQSHQNLTESNRFDGTISQRFVARSKMPTMLRD